MRFERFYTSAVCVFVFRVKKLKETLVTMQQLDKNMSNLRSWLSRIEAELSRPITYSVCHHQEIQRRLAEQQVFDPAVCSCPAQPLFYLFICVSLHSMSCVASPLSIYPVYFYSIVTF